MAVNGATSTWSGYNHQGKVGLLVALREINRLMAENSELNIDEKLELLAKWYVAFESSREDFDIYTKLDDVVVPYSRHQVKAKTSGVNESDYAKVLKPRTKTNKDGTTTVVDGFDCTSIGEDSRYLHVIRDINLTGWDNRYCVQLYEYPSLNGAAAKSYCDFSSVDADDDEVIQMGLHQLGNLFDTKTDIERKIIWKDLQYQLSVMIARGHRDGTIAELSFKEIYQASLCSEISGYDSDRFQRSILEYWDDYLEENKDNASFTDEMYERTNKYVQNLTCLQTDDLLRVVRIMHPNESAGNRNLNKDGLKQVVLKVISEVTSQLEGAECVKLDSSSSSLILTTITNLNQEDAGSSRVAANRIIKTISEEGDVASLFTRSKIINKSLNSSFLDLADVDPETGRIAGKDYEDISTYAPLEFISANNAILELNEDAT
jgi:hypothetical protein